MKWLFKIMLFSINNKNVKESKSSLEYFREKSIKLFDSNLKIIHLKLLKFRYFSGLKMVTATILYTIQIIYYGEFHYIALRNTKTSFTYWINEFHTNRIESCTNTDTGTANTTMKQLLLLRSNVYFR